MSRTLLAVIILIAWVDSARAQDDSPGDAPGERTPVTAVYDFSGNSTCPTTDDGINQPLYRLTFSDITRHGVTCQEGESMFNSNRWHEGDYVAFSVQPVAEYELVIGAEDSLTFWAQRSAAAPSDFRLTYQVGDGEPEVIKSWRLGGHETEITLYEADLPELTTQKEITFAIEATRSGSHWNGLMGFDDVKVQLSSRKIKTSTDVASRPGQPRAYRLLENYPNPFNPSTTIPFALPEAVHVRLTLQNVLGERMRVLVDRQLPAGRHAARLTAHDLASGTYFVRMSAGEFVQTRSVVFFK